MTPEPPPARRQRRADRDREDEVRIARIRRDARRPLAVNLAEGLALSELMAEFTGAAHRARTPAT